MVKRQMFSAGYRHCDYCGIKLTRATATADHVVAVSKGGTDHRENIVFACKPCNKDKRSMSKKEFLLILPKLLQERNREVGGTEEREDGGIIAVSILRWQS